MYGIYKTSGINSYDEKHVLPMSPIRCSSYLNREIPTDEQSLWIVIDGF